MLFADYSCISENTIKIMNEKGLFELMGLAWSSIIIIQENGKAHIESVIDCDGIGNFVPEKALNEYKNKIFQNCQEYGTFTYQKMYFSYFLIRTDINYKVYYFFAKTSELTEHDIKWFHIYLKKAYSALLVGNELLQYHEYLTNVIDSIDSYVMVFDLCMALISYNARSRTLFQKKDNNEKYTLEDIKFDHIKELKSTIRTVIATGQRSAVEGVLFKQPQNDMIFSIIVVPLHNSKKDVTGVVLICRDFSHTYMLQFKNETIQKYQFTSDIALGLSHDIKNPLLNIQSCVGYVLQHELNKDTQEEFLNQINFETKRINTIVDQLLSYCSVSTEDAPGYLDINNIINTCILVASRQRLFKNINIDMELEQNIPGFRAISGEIYMVLLNVIINAVQAIENKGSILVTSSYHQKNNMIIIEITDDGPGIDHDSFKKVFTPFYTTKPKGSGLGLYMSRRVLKRYRGKIEVESKPYKATTFTIKLPVENAQ